eukprot:169212-Chlamydomonas_euryale.AAC.2
MRAWEAGCACVSFSEHPLCGMRTPLVWGTQVGTSGARCVPYTCAKLAPSPVVAYKLRRRTLCVAGVQGG